MKHPLGTATGQAGSLLYLASGTNKAWIPEEALKHETCRATLHHIHFPRAYTDTSYRLSIDRCLLPILGYGCLSGFG